MPKTLTLTLSKKIQVHANLLIHPMVLNTRIQIKSEATKDLAIAKLIAMVENMKFFLTQDCLPNKWSKSPEIDCPQSIEMCNL